ncbi:hypothetical protein ACNR9Q_00310 [Maribacter sp. X9]|uniref:hypothetical protein n=1 Tax=Maribacter sp. X9 TaxID=3402159 RepID=UPI003AF3E9BA
MKTKQSHFFMITFIFSATLFSQDFSRDLKVIEAYEVEIDKGRENLLKQITKLESVENPNLDLINKKKAQYENYIFNDKMLNILFAEEVGSFFNNSDNLTLQEYFASVSADDKSLSLGFTVNSRGKNALRPLNMVYNFGVKVKAKNKFASIFENGDFNQKSDLGISFNITKVHFIAGAINFSSVKDGNNNIIFNRRALIETYRKKLYADYRGKIKEYKVKTLPKEEDSIRAIQNQMRGYKHKPDISKIYKEKGASLYQSLAEDEIKYIKENKAYSFISSDWVSLDGFLPVTNTTYNILINDNSGNFKAETFVPWRASLSWSYFRKYSNNRSWFISPKISVQNNNNILLEDLTAETLIVERQIFGNGSELETTESVYKEYSEFITPSFGAEFTYFFTKNIGVSPSFEKNVGTYDEFNWKLGVPISLKDKDGKPKVNFELQWKKVNTLTESNYLVGISASFLFGNLIN